MGPDSHFPCVTVGLLPMQKRQRHAPPPLPLAACPALGLSQGQADDWRGLRELFDSTGGPGWANSGGWDVAGQPTAVCEG